MPKKNLQPNQDLSTINEEELGALHFDIVLEIAYIARDAVRIQDRIKYLSAQLDMLDNEMELRQARKEGKDNQ